jgi:hypothetical protein
MSENTAVSCTTHQKSQHPLLMWVQEPNWRCICASASNTRTPQAGCFQLLSRQPPQFSWRPTAWLPPLPEELRCTHFSRKLTMKKLYSLCYSSTFSLVLLLICGASNSCKRRNKLFVVVTQRMVFTSVVDLKLFFFRIRIRLWA